MKKHLFRAVSLMLLAALCLTLFAGCSPRKATIFTVNGDDVCYDDIMVHLFFQKYDLFSSQISNGTMTFDNLYNLDVDMLSKELSDGVTLSDYLLLTATNTALSAQLCRQLAKENKLKITASDKKTIEATREQFIQTLGGAKSFNTFLKKSGTTDGAYTRYLENSLYMFKLLKLFGDGQKFALTADEKDKAKEDYAEQYISTRQLLFLTINSSTGTSLSDAEIEKAHQRAQAALARLKNGEDFEAVRKDGEVDNASEGTLTFTTGEMVSEYETAAFALQVGEISDLVKTKYGYHIIIRDELSNDKYATYYQTVIQAKFQNYLNEHSEAAKIKINDKNYDSIVVR